MALVQTLILFIIYQSVNSVPDGPALYQITHPFDHSEGPIWDPRRGLLYFVDIFDGGILSYNYTSNKVSALRFPGTVAVVTPSKNNPELLLFALNRSVAAINWDGNIDAESPGIEILTTVGNEYPLSRLNEGKADKEGRLWYGTMGEEVAGSAAPGHGLVYLITKENLANPEVRIAPVTTSNGLAWNRNNTRFYYIDTPTLQVVEYKYYDENGTISDPVVVFDVTEHDDIIGHPDGMTIDSEDNLWVALNDGGAVVQVDPSSRQVLQVIAIPATSITSVMFGGPRMDILFVTTSRHYLSDEQRLKQPAAGSVFAIENTGSTGVELFWADII